jgi:hypothetical protein
VAIPDAEAPPAERRRTLRAQLKRREARREGSRVVCLLDGGCLHAFELGDAERVRLERVEATDAKEALRKWARRAKPKRPFLVVVNDPRTVYQEVEVRDAPVHVLQAQVLRAVKDRGTDPATSAVLFSPRPVASGGAARLLVAAIPDDLLGGGGLKALERFARLTVPALVVPDGLWLYVGRSACQALVVVTGAPVKARVLRTAGIDVLASRSFEPGISLGDVAAGRGSERDVAALEQWIGSLVGELAETGRFWQADLGRSVAAWAVVGDGVESAWPWLSREAASRGVGLSRRPIGLEITSGTGPTSSPWVHGLGVAALAADPEGSVVRALGPGAEASPGPLWSRARAHWRGAGLVTLAGAVALGAPLVASSLTVSSARASLTQDQVQAAAVSPYVALHHYVERRAAMLEAARASSPKWSQVLDELLSSAPPGTTITDISMSPNATSVAIVMNATAPPKATSLPVRWADALEKAGLGQAVVTSLSESTTVIEFSLTIGASTT